MSSFSKKHDSSDGYAHTCKECHNKYAREVWYPRNTERQKLASKMYKVNNKYQVIAQRYGVKREVIESLYSGSKGKCAICKIESEKLVVDHCHSTGKVRGLLCIICNYGLGYFKDNPKSLSSAMKYLSKN